MIFDVMQAAAAEPVPWWMSATAPWWATPLATLAGAVLAWVLARATAARTERVADERASRELRRQVYAEFWANAIEYNRVLSHKDWTERMTATRRAAELMLSIELLASKDVRDTASKWVDVMMEHQTAADNWPEQAAAFRDAVAREYRAR